LLIEKVVFAYGVSAFFFCRNSGCHI
jgi:hypothetical protein